MWSQRVPYNSHLIQTANLVILSCAGGSKCSCKYEHKPQEASRIFILQSDKSPGFSLIRAISCSCSYRLAKWQIFLQELQTLRVIESYKSLTAFVPIYKKRSCPWKVGVFFSFRSSFSRQDGIAGYQPRLLNLSKIVICNVNSSLAWLSTLSSMPGSH